MQVFISKRLMAADLQQNLQELVKLYEAKLLQTTLEQLRDILRPEVTLEDLENVVAQDRTITIPSALDVVDELLKSNYNSDAVLREAFDVSNQFLQVQEELEFFSELLSDNATVN